MAFLALKPNHDHRINFEKEASVSFLSDFSVAETEDENKTTFPVVISIVIGTLLSLAFNLYVFWVVYSFYITLKEPEIKNYDDVEEAK